MWRSNSSVDSFLGDCLDHLNVTFTTLTLFGSWGGVNHTDAVAEKESLWMLGRLSERARAMGWSKVEQVEVFSRFRFAANSVTSWAEWALATLEAWPQNVTTLESPALDGPVTRLDGEYSVFSWPAEPSAGPWALVDGGDAGCASLPSKGNVNGSAIVLGFYADADGYPADPKTCTFGDMGRRATSLGASALILYPVTPGGDDAPVAQPNCSEGVAACTAGVGIPLTAVTAAAGRRLRLAAGSASGTTATLRDVPAPANELLIGGDQTLSQVGWRKFATLQLLSWAAQYSNYKTRFDANFTRAKPKIVPVLMHAEMKGHEGARKTVELPARSGLLPNASARILLDVSLGCSGLLDESCPVWDRIMSLTACCSAAGSAAASCEPFELGRWITPFRRGDGRWTTDVTPLSSQLLPHEQTTCNFTMRSDWWAQAWYPSLYLRFETAPARDEARAAPEKGAGGRLPVSAWGPSASASFLFAGGKFNASYNDNRTLIVQRPAGATRAALFAVITGHGSDNNGCGEFCATEHVFQVNGRNHSVAFSDAGDFWGSTRSVLDGTIPNQHGTWQYGRDGWFDGNKVRPWVVDVTDSVANATTVSYWGLFEGHTPRPTSSGAVIDMTSWLVWWA